MNANSRMVVPLTCGVFTFEQILPSSQDTDAILNKDLIMQKSRQPVSAKSSRPPLAFKKNSMQPESQVEKKTTCKVTDAKLQAFQKCMVKQIAQLRASDRSLGKENIPTSQLLSSQFSLLPQFKRRLQSASRFRKSPSCTNRNEVGNSVSFERSNSAKQKSSTNHPDHIAIGTKSMQQIMQLRFTSNKQDQPATLPLAKIRTGRV